MFEQQRIAWFIDKLSGFFATYRFPLLFAGVLIYFLALGQGSLSLLYRAISIVFGAFAGLHLLVARHYLVNLQDQNPKILLYPLPLYAVYFYFLATTATIGSGISFALFIVGLSMFNVVDIFWRDLKR